MTILLIVLIGLLLTAAIIVMDLKALKWILQGGLKNRKRRFFVVYLPLALWLFCSAAMCFMASPEVKQYLRMPFLFLGSVYGIAFTQHYFIGDESYGITSSQVRSMLIGGFLVIAVALDAVSFLRVNTTPSMPRGVYTLSPVAVKPLRGDLVTFCLESDNAFTAIAKERAYIGEGTCPSGLKPFLKVLAGLPGDMVEVSTDGIILNGSYLVGTIRPPYDSRGRTVPTSLLRDGPIPPGQALVISQEHSGSLDSRHFGLVPYDSLQKVSPLLIYKENDQDE